jgi:hypothetical protein
LRADVKEKKVQNHRKEAHVRRKDKYKVNGSNIKK